MRNFQLPGRSAAYATGAMAATSSPLATLAALDVLRRGGNATDAAVTASAVLCITEPHMTGIGGDCFALIGKADGSVAGLNASGRASMRADADWLKAAKLEAISQDSVHSVTVPGAIDGWDRLLKRFGTMTLGDALKPAIALAEVGVPVTPRVAQDWIDEEAMLAGDEGGRQHLLANGKAPRAGNVMRYPALAKTMRLIAKEGRAAFYEGAITKDIVQHLAKRGSLLTEADFAATEADWVEPIATDFHGTEILEIPPSGQGITALIALNVLKRVDVARHAPGSVERHHLQIEAMKLAWVLRNRHVADPGFANVPVDELLSDRIADKLAGALDAKRALDDPAARVPQPGSDTIYLTVVDTDRMAVSFINSIYHAFGSGIVTPTTGIALHSRGAGFVTHPDHPNCIGPGKRPLHTIIPAMARKDGQVILSFGVMGGAYQPMGHVTVALNRFVYGMDVQESLAFPRLFPDQGIVAVEAGIDGGVRAGLATRGHTLIDCANPLGGGQAIAIDPASGMLEGGSDHRKDGLALGF